MTIAMAIGTHNLSAALIIILAVVIIGVVIYFITKHRKNPPNGHAR